MKKILEFFWMILYGLGAIIGLFAGGIVLIVATLFNKVFTNKSIY